MEFSAALQAQLERILKIWTRKSQQQCPYWDMDKYQLVIQLNHISLLRWPRKLLPLRRILLVAWSRPARLLHRISSLVAPWESPGWKYTPQVLPYCHFPLPMLTHRHLCFLISTGASLCVAETSGSRKTKTSTSESLKIKTQTHTNTCSSLF